MRFKITRRSIQMPAVPYYGVQQGGIGYIKLNEFTENSAKIVRNAFIDMRHQQIKGLILDLRNNGGGSELEAANLVNLFVPKGVTVVSNRGKLKRANHDYKTTSEPIDPVRFIGNYSTGKMGFALADEAARRGADVTVVAGPVQGRASEPSVRTVSVTSARQMLEATKAQAADADIVIFAAAVADYAPAEVHGTQTQMG